jgi:uncharacterized lipoprotein YddW (UPF0748 family)
MDPTDPLVREHSLNVIKDVVRRYDIDGVHFDDYFYPYPITENGSKVEFPDDLNWQRYSESAAAMSTAKMLRIPLKRDDWRRANVNQFIELVGREIKRIKPRIVYGISPFGVAEENFKNLYADAVKWLGDGVVDYFVPQLYWKTDRKDREFPLLLKSWEERNPLKRHVWAGLGTYKIGDPRESFTAAEIVGQIELSRRIQKSGGSIQFSFKSIRNDLGGIQTALADGPYKRGAVIPEFSWISSPPPPRPRVRTERAGEYLRVRWTESGRGDTFWFVVQVRDKNGWSQSVLPANEKSITLSADREIAQVVVRSVDRLGKISAP